MVEGDVNPEAVEEVEVTSVSTTAELLSAPHPGEVPASPDAP